MNDDEDEDEITLDEEEVGDFLYELYGITEAGMNDNIFHGKVILNVLANWKGSYSEDSLLRSLLDRFPGEVAQTIGWIPQIRKMEEEWQAQQKDANEFVSSFPNYSKFMTAEDIRSIIIDPMIAACPAYAEDFPISQTCKTLGGLLDLTEKEMVFLQLAIDFRQLCYPTDGLYPRMASCFDNKTNMYSVMLNMSRSEVKDIMEGFLMKSGFLTPSTYPEGFFVMNPVFEETFRDQDILPEDVEKLIFPNALSTDLALTDYEHIQSEVERTSRIINNALENKTHGTNILFWGPAGTGKTELAVALAAAHGWNIRSVGDISPIDTAEKSRSERLTNLKIALKLFNDDGKTVLLFDEIEDLFKVDNNASFSKAFINRIIETTTVPIIWTTNSLDVLGSPVLRRMTYNINCTTPPQKARRNMWEKYADKYGVALDDDTKKMLDCFDISPALIHNTMKITGAAITNKDESNQNEVREIVTSLDRLVNYGAKRKFPPVEKEDPLYDVSCVNTEHDLTGFTDRLVNAESMAFSLCLYGPPGTGKSNYGRYLAGKLGKQLMLKRASDLISMWVGETEKLIAAAFEEAKEEGRVLLIDEGDTFLQDRGGAKHSWEISQVNEMLSQMETHTQPFILTTNLMDNLDPASLRRFTFKMKFDYITPMQAKRLFERYYRVAPPSRIERNHLLTPGDIACVHKQVQILGIKDGETIYRMIEKECELKPNFSKGMGFGC